MTGELFVEGVKAVWDADHIVKVALYSHRPDAQPHPQVVVCRLVATREDLATIATGILEALGMESPPAATGAAQPNAAPQERDEVLLARSDP